MGYQAPVGVIILFCLLLCALYLVRRVASLESQYLQAVLSVNLLAAAHGILVLWFLDVVVPHVLFWVLNRTLRWHSWLWSNKMRFKK